MNLPGPTPDDVGKGARVDFDVRDPSPSGASVAAGPRRTSRGAAPEVSPWKICIQM